MLAVGLSLRAGLWKIILILIQPTLNWQRSSDATPSLQATEAGAYAQDVNVFPTAVETIAAFEHNVTLWH